MNKNNRIGGRVGFVIGCVAIYLAAVGLIATAVKIPETMTKMKENNEIKNAKVVLYDGPKSLADATEADLELGSEESRDITLKHSVDTMVTVNGKDCYVYETNVNNTHTWMGDYLPAQDRTPITYFDFEGMVHENLPQIVTGCTTLRELYIK